MAECCKGFYGPDCKPCIGGFQHPCYDKGTVSKIQTALSPEPRLLTDVTFFFKKTTYSALMVSMATAHAAVSQTGRVLLATSAQIQPSMEKTVMKVTASLH